MRPIFIANVTANEDANRYLPQARRKGYDIDLWDLGRLGAILKQLSRDWFVEEPSSLIINPDRKFIVGPKGTSNLVYAAVRAKELVNLPGIDDLRIFAQNVRLGLGNTRVNTEIIASLQNKKEHPDFFNFHNGLTIVAKELKCRGQKVYLNKFSVCNGCQSLLLFWENRQFLTDALEILVRIVRVGDDRRLPEVIAYRTNNQNAITLRDLSSNDSVQVQLKSEFDGLYGKYATYSIKRGEKGAGEELQNEYAGRLLLAFYVGEPWSAHQKYRIFGDLEQRIFTYDVSAQHIRFAQLVGESGRKALSKLKYERIGKYGLTLYVLVYLIGKILESSKDGKLLLSGPGPYLKTINHDNPLENKILKHVDQIAAFSVTELNFYIKGQGGENYDYKSEFKSPKDIGAIGDAVLKAFEKDVAVGRMKELSLPKIPARRRNPKNK